MIPKAVFSPIVVCIFLIHCLLVQQKLCLIALCHLILSRHRFQFSIIFCLKRHVEVCKGGIRCAHGFCMVCSAFGLWSIFGGRETKKPCTRKLGLLQLAASNRPVGWMA